MWKHKFVYKYVITLLSVLLLLCSCTSVPTDQSANSDNNSTIENIKGDSSSEYATDEDFSVTQIEIEESLPESEPTDSSEEEDVIEEQEADILQLQDPQYEGFDISLVPKYSGSPYVVVNGNIPYFSVSGVAPVSMEYYSDLDDLGRCGVTYACIGTDIMPTEERGEIGNVKPSGWNQNKYPGVIEALYLMNRGHCLGYQLTAENDNPSNLISSTRYMNVDGMLPFENMVADYVKETENHVVYRVTPIFEGDNLLATGVLMEGYSLEDDGDDICFNVFCYNVQPGIYIDYSDGSNYLIEDVTESVPEEGTEAESSEEPEPEEEPSESAGATYILNTNTKKFHYPSCSSVDQMADKNKQEYTGNRDELISSGYDACKRCNP